jgi:hypothetical protein
MSDDNTQIEDGEGTAPNAPREIDLLKQQAKLMNISFSNNISVDKLREKIAEKLNADNGGAGDNGSDDDDQDEEVVTTSAASGQDDGETAAPAAPVRKTAKQTLRAELQKEQLKLVRVRIACLDPKKKDLPGEIVTVGNRFIGTVSKYVPFGEATDNGYHIPYIIYRHLEDRRFLNIRTRKVDGKEQVSHVTSKEFAIEVLPQLTPKELERLAAAQAAAGSIDNSLGDQ